MTSLDAPESHNIAKLQGGEAAPQKRPLVTIVTVVLNGAKTLEHTIESVIKQTYKNRDYIIVDGGSTDGTLDIIKKYARYLARWMSAVDSEVVEL